MTQRRQVPEKEGWYHIGMVGVDSGQLMICDPCYIDSEWKNEDFEGFDEKPKHNFSYAAACKASHSGTNQLNYKRGHEGVAVVSTTGFGDGEYPVYAFYKDCGQHGMRVARLEVVIIEDGDGQ